MLFVSLVFIFGFLPIVLGLYYVLKGHRKVQNIVLFLASLFFYAWGEPEFVMILLASIVFNWGAAILIDKSERMQVKRGILVAAIVINIGVLFVYKYLNFFTIQLNRVGLFSTVITDIALPIGISFFTFQALSYVIDVYRGERCQYNPLYVGLYISFFPQLIAGPIVRYNSIEKQIMNRTETVDGFKDGVVRFIEGFSKKVLLANTMAIIADKAFDMVGNDLTVSFAWLGAISYTLQIYFDFSGYSDMAIGLGKMFGFEFDENFNYPYISASVTEFWRRWHISLSTWFRDYVYIPLGGNRTGNNLHNYFNLLTVWLLTGIWHGANWTFIAWGLLYFVFLLIEKATGFGKFIGNHRIVGHIYSLLVVNLLWVIFRANGIHQAVDYIGTMFGLSDVRFFSGQTLVYIRENIVYFVFAIALSSGIITKIKKSIFIELSTLLMFIVSIVYIINETYNPFIYFHF